MSFTDLTIEDYTDKSIAVQGNTRKYKEDLKKLGGKYNGSLKNGPGWIFPKTLEKELRTIVKNDWQQLLPSMGPLKGYGVCFFKICGPCVIVCAIKFQHSLYDIYEP